MRTPAEHAHGHLAGSLLLGIQGSTFAADLDELDRDGTYVVYCRTGNRSATAADRMASMGFTEVLDAGAYDDLAEAGAVTTTRARRLGPGRARAGRTAHLYAATTAAPDEPDVTR